MKSVKPRRYYLIEVVVTVSPGNLDFFFFFKTDLLVKAKNYSENYYKSINIMFSVVKFRLLRELICRLEF